MQLYQAVLCLHISSADNLFDRVEFLVQALAEERRSLDGQFLQNIGGEQIAIDFCPEIASRVIARNLASPYQTTAIVANEHNQVMLILDLPKQESYTSLQPSLLRLDARARCLQGKVKQPLFLILSVSSFWIFLPTAVLQFQIMALFGSVLCSSVST